MKNLRHQMGEDRQPKCWMNNIRHTSLSMLFILLQVVTEEANQSVEGGL